MPTRGALLRRSPIQECELGDLARYLSMAILVRKGASTSATDLSTIATSAIATCHLYGLRYVSSRRISRLSYALPNTSSSWLEAIGAETDLNKDYLNRWPGGWAGWKTLQPIVLLAG